MHYDEAGNGKGAGDETASQQPAYMLSLNLSAIGQMASETCYGVVYHGEVLGLKLCFFEHTHRSEWYWQERDTF
jgi:hypothetical protein